LSEIEVFGRENVSKVQGRRKVFTIKPAETGNCPHFLLTFEQGSCKLGARRPRACRAYPIMYDGKKWYLDAGCPEASSLIFRSAMTSGPDRSFVVRAIRSLSKIGKLIGPVVAKRASVWLFPLVLGEIPDFVLTRKERKKRVG